MRDRFALRKEGFAMAAEDERESSEREAYVARFLSLSESVERRLLQAIVALFLLLALMQGLLTIDAVRGRITEVERLEGRSYGFAPLPDRVLY